MTRDDMTPSFEDWVTAHSGSALPVHDDGEASVGQAWLQHHEHYEFQNHYRQGVSGALSHCSRNLAAMTGGNTPVVMGCSLVGPDRDQALLADDHYFHASHADRQKKLELAPLTGVAMIFNMAREKSGYHPDRPAQAGSRQGFLNYVRSIVSCPVFRQEYVNTVTPSYSGSSWDGAVSSITNQFEGVDGNGKNEIKTSLYNLARSASSSPSTSMSVNLFAQHALFAGTSVYAYLYYCHVQMRHEVRDGGKNSPDIVTNQSNMNLTRAKLYFDKSKWPSYAPVMMDRTNATLRSWLGDNSTRGGSASPGWTS